MVDSTIVRAMSRRPAQKGQDGQALADRAAAFQQNPPEVRFRWLAAGLPLTGGEASDSRNFEILLDIGPDITRGRCSATKATTPRRTERRRAGAASAPPSRTARMPRQTAFFPRYSTKDAPAPNRASQDQALQTHRLALREDAQNFAALSRSPAPLSW